MKDLRIVIKEFLTASEIKNIIRVVNDSVGREIISKDNSERPILAKRFTLEDGFNAYVFTFSSPITGIEADSIVGGLYTALEYDFVAEIDAESQPEFEHDFEENIEESETVKHSKWLNEKLKEGWVYGMEFNKKTKHSPYLRPYHLLTKNQKKAIQQSSAKLGFYGFDLNDDNSSADSGE